MATPRMHIALVAWTGATVGALAWLVRLALAWLDADASAMGWGTIGVCVLAAVVSYALYRLQEHMGGPKTMAVFSSILAALTSGLLLVAAAANAMDSLPIAFRPNWLWAAPALYAAIAVALWVWGNGLARKGREAVS